MNQPQGSLDPAGSGLERAPAGAPRERRGAGFVLPWRKAAGAVLALGAVGAALVGYGLLRSEPPPGRRARGSPRLKGLVSSIPARKHDNDGSKSLNFASLSGPGQLSWEADAPRAASEAPAPAAPPRPERAAAEPPPQGFDVMKRFNDQNNAYLARTHPGRVEKPRPTGKLGGGSFGGKSIFSGIDMPGAKFKLPGKGGLSERAQALKRPKAPMSARRLDGSQVSASSPQRGAQPAGVEAGSSYGMRAFEQMSSGSGDIVHPQGSGAPSLTDQPSAPSCPGGWSMTQGGGCEPPAVAGRNATPYQGLADSAQQISGTVKKLLLAAAALAAAGAALVFAYPPAGAALLATAAALAVVAQSLFSIGQQMGRSVGDGYGQKTQAVGEERNATYNP